MGAACGKEGGAAGEPMSDAGKTSQPQPASVSKAEASDMGLAGEGSAASTGDGGASAALDDGGRAALQKQVTSKMKTKRVREVYKLGKTLGTGGFSVVKLAVDRTTGDEYACKVMALPPPGAELDDYSNTREDIIKEIEILCTMEHPSIIYLKEFYDENNKVYLITELLTGGELLDAVLARGSYTEEDARVCFGKLLSALGYLHEQKIAHRDLKLENLLLVDSSDITNIKLADFGLAKVSAAQAQMQTVCGTPQYVAPEVINEEASDSYGVEVDMWSAGVVLFVLLGGYPPFYDESEPKLFAAIQKGEFAFDDEVWTDISDLAKDLIRKLIEVDPKKRLSARQALHHPWVTGPQAQVDLSGTRQNMENRMRKKLKAKVRSVIAANRMKLLAGAMGAGKMDDTVPEGNEEEEEEEDEDALLREQGVKVASAPAAE
eukprot:jgi/Tetstr1/461333/TSEL_006459.t1